MIQKEIQTANTKLLDIIPVIGFGTWKLNGKDCAEGVADALQAGYRHIDTAQMYNNEAEVGKGIKDSGIGRESVFLTTKIAVNNLEPYLIHKSFKESLSKLNTDYTDLLLIHWPKPGMDLKACLEAMSELREQGLVKHLGVSNFNPGLFLNALEMTELLTNQVKFSPYEPNNDILDIAKRKNKLVTAYSPLDEGDITDDNLLKAIGEKYNKSASQVALRWLIDLGNMVVIPKSSSKKHRRENLDIFDFKLSSNEIQSISKEHTTVD